MINSFYYWGSKGLQILIKIGLVYLIKREIKDWVLFDNNEVVVEEVEYLIERLDLDKDGKLFIEEIVNNYEDFVGSQVINYGEFFFKDEF